jgi:hypothetical protein
MIIERPKDISNIRELCWWKYIQLEVHGTTQHGGSVQYLEQSEDHSRPCEIPCAFQGNVKKCAY